MVALHMGRPKLLIIAAACFAAAVSTTSITAVPASASLSGQRQLEPQPAETTVPISPAGSEDRGQPNPADAVADAGIDVAATVGLNNRYGTNNPLPVRIEVTSDRSRQVEVVVESNVGDTAYRLDLNRDATAFIDHVGLTIGLPTAIVVSEDGRRIARVPLQPMKASGSLVGVTSNLAPDTAQTIDLFDNTFSATIDRVDAEWLKRPAALEHLGELVVSTAELDGFDEGLKRRIGHWVWAGGRLVIDGVAPAHDPVFDQPIDATEAQRGAGQIRFVGDAAVRGDWRNVVQPQLDTGTAIGPEDQWFGDVGNDLSWRGLIETERASTSTLLGLLALSMLLIGPALWFVLRKTGRPQFMWFAAPLLALAIGGLVVMIGRGNLDVARPVIYGRQSVSPLGSTHAAITATAGTAQTRLPQGWNVTGSSNSVVVDGDKVTTRGEGTGWEPLVAGSFELDETSPITLVVTPAEGTLVHVAVTNHTDSPLVAAEVSGFGRSRSFDRVRPGETVTLDFETAQDIDAWAKPFGWGLATSDCAMMCDSNVNFGGFPIIDNMVTNGVVRVAGYLADDDDTFGQDRSRLDVVAATATVSGWSGPVDPDAAHAAFIVEPLGGTRDGWSAYRITANASVATARCSIADFVDDVAIWDEENPHWAAIPFGVEGLSERYVDPIGVRTYDLGAAEPGWQRIIRFRAGEFQIQSSSNHILCGVQP